MCRKWEWIVACFCEVIWRRWRTVISVRLRNVSHVEGKQVPRLRPQQQQEHSQWNETRNCFAVVQRSSQWNIVPQCIYFLVYFTHLFPVFFLRRNVRSSILAVSAGLIVAQVLFYAALHGTRSMWKASFYPQAFMVATGRKKVVHCCCSTPRIGKLKSIAHYHTSNVCSLNHPFAEETHLPPTVLLPSFPIRVHHILPPQ